MVSRLYSGTRGRNVGAFASRYGRMRKAPPPRPAFLFYWKTLTRKARVLEHAQKPTTKLGLHFRGRTACRRCVPAGRIGKCSITCDTNRSASNRLRNIQPTNEDDAGVDHATTSCAIDGRSWRPRSDRYARNGKNKGIKRKNPMSQIFLFFFNLY